MILFTRKTCDNLVCVHVTFIPVSIRTRELGRAVIQGGEGVTKEGRKCFI